MADLNQKYEKMGEQGSKVMQKIEAIKEKIDKIDSPIKLRYYQFVMQRLQNKLFRIQDKRMALGEESVVRDNINEVYNDNIGHYNGIFEYQMQEKWLRIQDIGKRLRSIETEKRSILEGIDGFSEEELQTYDPIVEGTRRRIDKKYRRASGIAREEDHTGIDEEQETGLPIEIEELHAELDDLESERYSLIEERANLREERIKMAKEYEMAVKQAEKSRKKDLAVIKPSIFKRVTSFIKDKLNEIKTNRETRKENKAEKVAQMKEDIINTTASDKVNRQAISPKVEVDYTAMQGKVSEIFTKRDEPVIEGEEQEL